MKTAIILMALCLVGALADGIGSHRHGRNHRQGRRSQGVSSRRQGRNRASFRSAPFRRGRQEDLDAVAPVDAYGAAETTAAPEVLPPPADYPDYGLDTYESEAPLGGYGADADALSDEAADPNLAMLEKAVPGIPGEDYPINAEVPDTPFSCEGQVDGGYYADPEAQCQVFHICTADGQGGLAKYSFLCPNGTIFNQNYFICDWWFNFDCAEAEGLYGLNDEIAAERDALAGGEEAPADSYGAAPEEAALDEAYDYYGDEAAAIDEYAAEEVVPTYEADTEAPLDTYAADEAVLPTAIPTYEESESREARRFSGRRGRNGRRNNSSQRQGRRQGGSRRNNRRGQRNQQGRRGRNNRG